MLVGARDRREFQRRGNDSLAHALARDRAAGEEALTEIHAAHVQTVGAHGFVVLTQNALRAPATDVDHKPALGGACGEVRDSEIDQTRLFATGDDLDRVAEGLTRPQQESPGVLGLAQGAGAHGADAARRMLAQALAEAFEAFEGALGDLFLDRFRLVEAVGQGDSIAQTIEDEQFSVNVLRDNHVEAVRAQVHRRHGLSRRGVGATLFRHVGCSVRSHGMRCKPGRDCRGIQRPVCARTQRRQRS